jgi:hypothetical protein
MRLALAVILPSALIAATTGASRLLRVTGSAERVIHAPGPCGGGARITDEQMQEWAAKTQRSSLVKAAFTVFAGERHDGKRVARFKTDGAGRFEVRLPEGTFCVMAGELPDVAPEPPDVTPEPATPPRARPSGNVDLQCLHDLALACDARLDVRRDTARDVKLLLETYQRCSEPWAQPCYRGPMPP